MDSGEDFRHLERVMGTIVGIRSPDPLPGEALRAAIAELYEANRIFSVWDPIVPCPGCVQDRPSSRTSKKATQYSFVLSLRVASSPANLVTAPSIHGLFLAVEPHRTGERLGGGAGAMCSSGWGQKHGDGERWR